MFSNAGGSPLAPNCVVTCGICLKAQPTETIHQPSSFHRINAASTTHFELSIWLGLQTDDSDRRPRAIFKGQNRKPKNTTHSSHQPSRNHPLGDVGLLDLRTDDGERGLYGVIKEHIIERNPGDLEAAPWRPTAHPTEPF